MSEPLVEDFQIRAMTARAEYPSAAAQYSEQQRKGTTSASADSDAFSAFEDDADAAPSPAIGRRDFSVPNNRASSATPGPSTHRRCNDSTSVYTSASSVPTTPDSRERSSVDSMFTPSTSATGSMSTLPPLQMRGLPNEADRLEPVMEDDPANFDLVAAPSEQATGMYELEKQSEMLVSPEHLERIFSESKLLLKFTNFLHAFRPQRIPILIYYLDALKALRAINYANAIAEALDVLPGFQFTAQAAQPTANAALKEKADKAFEELAREDLPAYIAHVWIQVVSTSMHRRITGQMAPHLRDASEGLAEVFCLTDPSRHDNPIVFVSEEFNRCTQYGLNYVIGRNCRFLQGPRTNRNSVRRLADACKLGKEHSEVFLNYRRDGSPFLNLLMVAPLFDSRGNLRYFIGAQVDVSGLLKESAGLEAYMRLVERAEHPELAKREDQENEKDEFRSLSEMLNVHELETVRHHGGGMHHDTVDDSDRESIVSHRPRLLLNDPTSDGLDQPKMYPSSPSVASVRSNGKLEGVYQNYLLIRPAPSLRILFTSPSLRVPGIMQSPFLSRIGGSPRVRNDLSQALSEGRGVTAKVRWLTRADDDGEGEGRTRWLHCTPLIGHSGAVGVWMVVLVDDTGTGPGDGQRRFRTAPPVANVIAGKQHDPQAAWERRQRDNSTFQSIIPDHTRRPREVSAEGYASPRRAPDHVAAQTRPQSSMSTRSVRDGGASELSFKLH